MKKAFTYICSLSLAFTLAGCAQENTADQTNETEAPEETEETVLTETEEPENTEGQTLLGGWQVNSSYSQLLTEEESSVFAKAAEGLSGASYSPVAAVAKKVVSGTDYAYLCFGKQVTGNDHGAYYIVTVHNSTENEASILNIAKLELSDIPVYENEPETLPGSWTVEGSGKPGALTEDGEKALTDALEGFTGVHLMPIALLGTQVVSGMNYRYLCYGTTVTEDPKTSLYVVTVYKSADGKCQIESNALLDLNACTTASEE